MKKIVTLALCFLIAMLSSYSLCGQEYKEHVVEKGETAASIAKKYNISEASLLKANPSLMNYCYVGMKVRIPIENVQGPTMSESSSLPKAVETKNTGKSAAVADAASSTNQPENHSGPFNIFCADLPKFGFLTNNDSEASTCVNLFMTAGINHYFDKSIYLGAQIGYGQTSFSTRIDNFNIENTSHFIMLPLELGYRLSLSGNQYKDLSGFALSPYVGADFSYLAKATTKVNDQKETLEPDNRFSVNAKLGIRITYASMGINTGYAFNDHGNYFYIGFTLLAYM